MHSVGRSAASHIARIGNTVRLQRQYDLATRASSTWAPRTTTTTATVGSALRCFSKATVSTRPLPFQQHCNSNLFSTNASSARFNVYQRRGIANESTPKPRVAPAGTTTTTNVANELATAVPTAPDGAGVDAVVAVAQRAHELGDLKAAGLVNFTPVGAIQALMEVMHVSAGVPWWAAIAGSTLLLRAVLLKPYMGVQRMSATLNLLKPKLEQIRSDLQVAQEQNDTHTTRQKHLEYVALLREHNVTPLKMFLLPFATIPVTISFFLAVRGILYAADAIESLKTGGILWFKDLSSPDPVGILPVVCSFLGLCYIEASARAGTTTMQMNPTLQNVMRGMALFTYFIAQGMPTGVLVYWVTANFFSIMQTLMLRLPKFRGFFKLPPLPPVPPPNETVLNIRNAQHPITLQSCIMATRKAKLQQQTAAAAAAATESTVAVAAPTPVEPLAKKAKREQDAPGYVPRAIPMQR